MKMCNMTTEQLRAKSPLSQEQVLRARLLQGISAAATLHKVNNVVLQCRPQRCVRVIGTDHCTRCGEPGCGEPGSRGSASKWTACVQLLERAEQVDANRVNATDNVYGSQELASELKLRSTSLLAFLRDSQRRAW